MGARCARLCLIRSQVSGELPPNRHPRLGRIAPPCASQFTSESMDLLDLLKRPEGKTLEFKRDLSSPDGALKTLVGFANTAGGTLILGVEGRTARVRGVQNALEVEERMARLISDSITPRLRSRIVGGGRLAPPRYSHPANS